MFKLRIDTLLIINLIILKGKLERIMKEIYFMLFIIFLQHHTMNSNVLYEQ